VGGRGWRRPLFDSALSQQWDFNVVGCECDFELSFSAVELRSSGYWEQAAAGLQDRSGSWAGPERHRCSRTWLELSQMASDPCRKPA